MYRKWLKSINIDNADCVSSMLFVSFERCINFFHEPIKQALVNKLSQCISFNSCLNNKENKLLNLLSIIYILKMWSWCTCCNVNRVVVSWILLVDKSSMRSSVLQPINLAAVRLASNTQKAKKGGNKIKKMITRNTI